MIKAISKKSIDPAWILSDSYDGIKRKLYKTECVSCKSFFYTKKNTKTTCNQTCRKEYQQKLRILVYCTTCNKEMSVVPSSINKRKSKSGFKFCSRVCKESAQTMDYNNNCILKPLHYNTSVGIRRYRTRAFRIYGKICNNCRYDKDERMLDVDHIDNNRKNNAIENLQVLCVWCHAWKTRIDNRKITYGNSNPVQKVSWPSTVKIKELMSNHRIKKVSELLGVSHQSIYRHLKKMEKENKNKT